MKWMKSWGSTLKLLLKLGPKQLQELPIDLSKDPHAEPNAWWGTFLVGEEQSRFFKIGPIVVCLDRYNHEWRITIRLEGSKTPFRSFAAKTSNHITLKPVLPDRPLLSTLDQPFYIAADDRLMLYLSVPLWISIEVGQPSILLDEIKTNNLAETWSGRNTIEGELCYANRTQAFAQMDAQLAQEEAGTTQVIIPISIVNRSKNTLLIDALKIPLPLLSIYTDATNSLWTEQLYFYQDETDRPLVQPSLQGPPKTLKEPRLLNGPRSVLKPTLRKLLIPFIRN